MSDDTEQPANYTIAVSWGRKVEAELQQAQAALAHEKETSAAAVLLLKRVTAEKTELLALLSQFETQAQMRRHELRYGRKAST